MQEYWQQVLAEVAQLRQSKVQSSQQGSCTRQSLRGCELPIGNIYLGGSYPSVYFTPREAQCALLLLRGMTIREVGQVMRLSARTIEYYLDNMKVKVACRRKSELIQAILASDFLVGFAGQMANT